MTLTADEARERANMARQERALERRRQKEEHTNRIEGLVDEEIDREIEEHDVLIRDASAEGLWEITSSRSSNEVERTMVDRLKEFYEGEGYKAKWLEVQVDFGNEAAPSVIEELQLTIGWREDHVGKRR